MRKIFGKANNDWRAKEKIDAITNQNVRLAALTNKDDRRDNYKEQFKKLVKKSLMK